jgi:glycerol-3-phosphate dehydrogenase
MAAEQAVDMAVGQLGLKTKKCQTHITPVAGGKIEDFRTFLQRALVNTPRVISERSTEHLVYTYGSQYPILVEFVLRQPDLARRIDPQLPVTVAEVEHAVHHEMAWTLLDVIQRRTEIGATGLPSMITLKRCAELMGRELSWTIERQAQEIDCVVQAYPFGQADTTTA